MVDHGGNMIGIAFVENPGPVFISIKTIMTCMEMWDQFRFVPFSYLLLSKCKIYRQSLLLTVHFHLLPLCQHPIS